MATTRAAARKKRSSAGTGKTVRIYCVSCQKHYNVSQSKVKKFVYHLPNGCKSTQVHGKCPKDGQNFSTIIKNDC